MRFVFILAFLLFGTGASSKPKKPNPLAESNKDVFVLATLIRSHLIQTGERTFNLSDIYKYDSLNRIENNFELVEFKYRGDYISYYFKFVKLRNQVIELNRKELERLYYPMWKKKKMKDRYDVEICIGYGERNYPVRKIILRKE